MSSVTEEIRNLEEAVENSLGLNLHHKSNSSSNSSNDGSDSDWATPADNANDNKLEFSKSSSFDEDLSDAELDQPDETQTSGARRTDLVEEPDPRPHLNVVFIGHVDAGKSTTCGQILVLTGEVDQRTLAKYEREAKEKAGDSWYFAYIMDVNEEERQRGKTVEVGRAAFSYGKLRFTILDAPGHKGYVPNMMSGAAQADVGVLIVSARKGEFETGFEKGGQTREHVLLAKTLGVSHLVIAINKMDESTCCWSEERFLEIKKKLLPFLKACGFNVAVEVTFVPISGLCGQNLKDHISLFPEWREKSSWYTKDQPTLLDVLDNLVIPTRDKDGPLRIPLLEGFRDQGVMASGKIESGTISMNQQLVLMPQKVKVKALSVLINDKAVSYALPGENILVKLSGTSEDQIKRGSILCSVEDICPVVLKVKAQLLILELLEHKPLVTLAYSCIIHIHTAVEECQFTALYDSVDRATKKKKLNPQFVRSNSVVTCEITFMNSVCAEASQVRSQLSRFTLRDEGKTIGIGKVIDIVGLASD